MLELHFIEEKTKSVARIAERNKNLLCIQSYVQIASDLWNIIQTKWLVINLFCCPYFYTSLCPGYIKAHTLPDKIVPDRARQKNYWFYLASWTRNCRKHERKQKTPDSVFICKQGGILALSGTIWPTSFKFPANGSVWHDFVWLSGP